MNSPQFKRFSEMSPEEIEAHDAKIRADRDADAAEARKKAAAGEVVRRQATMVPQEFLAAITGPVRDTEALAEVMRGDFRALVLAGAIGRGKTLAACWWLLDGKWPNKPELEPTGPRDPLFVSSARLSRWERYDNTAMDRLLLSSRLVIDDLGEEFNDTKGNFLAVLDETVSDRIANLRPTVITTNLDVEAFKARYGARITDRIRGAGRWFAVAGESMRGQP